jgi:hypothetical protein
MAIHGSCLCGTLRYEVEEPFTSMMNCHCSRCRKEHGAPFATFVTTAANGLRWISGEDAVVSYAAAPGGPRRFCRTCGSVAPFAMPEMDIAFIPAGELEEDPGIRPQAHMFAGSKAPWYAITDTLPQYEKYPPEFGDAPSLPDRKVEPVAGKSLGSCLCDAVGWEVAKPIASFQCHCSRCRRGRSAAHGANLFCRIDDFRWTRGEQLVADYKLPEARFYAVAFCRQCGGKVPRISKERGIVVVPMSALDTDPGIRPTAHIFVASKAPWFEITDQLTQYPGAPPSFGPSAAR